MSVALPVHRLTSRPEQALPAPRSRDLCSDCGISRSSHSSSCGRACQFIHPRYDELERATHGRSRRLEDANERLFGPFRRMVRGRLAEARAGAQWTGLTTRIAERLLERDEVDAVLATASMDSDRWAPRPVLVTHPEDMRACRGMKMGFSPILALLDEVERRGIRRLAVIGVPCQIHALRALESELGLDTLYVIGTPCADNTTTENFHTFLSLLTERPNEVAWLEFLPEFEVEMRFDDGESERIPFLQLPISELPADFFPLACRSCVDYTNALADVTVGYMGGAGDQWLIVRNERGERLVDLIADELVSRPLVEAGDRTGPVRGFMRAAERSAGGLPVRRTPRPLRPIVSWAMKRFGPRGLEFARARVEMKLIEAILTLRSERPRRVRRAIPDFAWHAARPYGLEPSSVEHPSEAPGASQPRAVA